MSFDLKSIYNGTLERPHRILLYGEEGAGKTTWGTSAKDSILISLKGEEGADAIDCAKFPVVETFQEFQKALEALCGEHEFKTLVIDSISTLEPLIWDHICKRDNKENIEAYGFGKGYNLAANEIKLILEALDYLRNKKNMQIIFIGHSKVSTFNDPSGDSFSKYDLDCHKSIMAILQRWIDGVFFARFKVLSKTVEKGFNSTEKKAISMKRVLCCQTNGSFTVKGRGALGQLPSELPLDYNVFLEELNKLKEQ